MFLASCHIAHIVKTDVKAIKKIELYIISFKLSLRMIFQIRGIKKPLRVPKREFQVVDAMPH